MNLSPLWARFLNDSAFQGIHWASVGSPDAPDSEILEYAVLHGYTLLTHDLDFSALLASRKSAQPSVIQLRTQDLMPATIWDMVVDTLNITRSHLESGAIVTLDVKGRRVRILPLH